MIACLSKTLVLHFSGTRNGGNTPRRSLIFLIPAALLHFSTQHINPMPSFTRIQRQWHHVFNLSSQQRWWRLSLTQTIRLYATSVCAVSTGSHQVWWRETMSILQEQWETMFWRKACAKVRAVAHNIKHYCCLPTDWPYRPAWTWGEPIKSYFIKHSVQKGYLFKVLPGESWG